MTAHDDETSRFRRRLVIIVVAGIAARAAVIVYAGQHPKTFDFPDSHRYFTVARNIAAGMGPIDSATVRSGTDPLYPLMLSIGAASGLQSDDQLMRWAQVVNTLASVVAIIATAKLARRLLGGRTALIGAAVLAIDPITLFFNALALTETVYVSLLLVSVVLLLPAGSRGSDFWRMIAGGLLLGGATLTRSSGIFLAPALGVVFFVWHWPSRDRTRNMAALAVSFAAVLAPVVLRNYAMFHRLVPVRTGSGASLMEALGPWADGGPGMDRIVYPAFPAGANEVERDGICRDAAIDWARQHPRRALGLAWTKLCRTWSITINASDYSSTLYKAVGWVSVAPVFALAAAGVVMMRERRGALALLLAPIAYFTILHMIFVGSVRYRMPAMPFVFMLAAVAITRLIGRRAEGG